MKFVNDKNIKRKMESFENNLYICNDLKLN